MNPNNQPPYKELSEDDAEDSFASFSNLGNKRPRNGDDQRPLANINLDVIKNLVKENFDLLQNDDGKRDIRRELGNVHIHVESNSGKIQSKKLSAVDGKYYNVLKQNLVKLKEEQIIHEKALKKSTDVLKKLTTHFNNNTLPDFLNTTPTFSAPVLAETINTALVDMRAKFLKDTLDALINGHKVQIETLTVRLTVEHQLQLLLDRLHHNATTYFRDVDLSSICDKIFDEAKDYLEQQTADKNIENVKQELARKEKEAKETADKQAAEKMILDEPAKPIEFLVNQAVSKATSDLQSKLDSVLKTLEHLNSQGGKTPPSTKQNKKKKGKPQTVNTPKVSFEQKSNNKNSKKNKNGKKEKQANPNQNGSAP